MGSFPRIYVSLLPAGSGHTSDTETQTVPMSSPSTQGGESWPTASHREQYQLLLGRTPKSPLGIKQLREKAVSQVLCLDEGMGEQKQSKR